MVLAPLQRIRTVINLNHIRVAVSIVLALVVVHHLLAALSQLTRLLALPLLLLPQDARLAGRGRVLD